VTFSDIAGRDDVFKLVLIDPATLAVKKELI